MADDGLAGALAARRRFGATLLANPDVHGVGVGRRRRDGVKTAEYAVVVHVARKLPQAAIAPGRLLPRALPRAAPDRDEPPAPVDVQERPPPRPEALDLRARVRPVPGGVSAGFSGTLGAWVWDPVTAQPVALSNRHVFGAFDDITITQPAGDDGGRAPADAIATVLRAGRLDAAIAAPLDPAVVSWEIAGGVAAFDVAAAAIDMRVRKTGRATGVTDGVVDLVGYDSGHDGAQADLWIDGDGADFSDGGDSGAVYVEAATGALVGLHWGGAGQDGVGHPIDAVFAELGVTTLPAALRPAPV